MFNELHHRHRCSPENVFRSVATLLTGALALDTGAVCDLGARDFNTGVDIILYVTRLTARVDSYVSFLVDHAGKLNHPFLPSSLCLPSTVCPETNSQIPFLVDHAEGTHPTIDAPLRGVDIKAIQGRLPALKDGLADLRRQLHGDVSSLLEEYLEKLDKETAGAGAGSAEQEALIDRNARLACDLHAHRLVCHRNVPLEDMSPAVVKTIVGSFIFLTTRHTWNKVRTIPSSPSL